MRRRDALRLFLLSPLTLRSDRSARGGVPADAVACYRAAVERLPKWTDEERQVVRGVATARLDLVAARLLRRARPALDALSLGSRAGACDWVDYWTGDRFAEVSWVHAADAARLALLRGRFAFASGWERKGMADVSDVLSMSGHLGLGRVFMAQIIGFAIEHAAIESVATALPHLSSPALSALSTRLGGLHEIPPLEEAVRGEREFFLGVGRGRSDEVDGQRTEGRLLFYERLIHAIRSQDEEGVLSLREAADGEREERERFLDHLDGIHRARLHLVARRALLLSAIAVVRDGPDAIDEVLDPNDGEPFALRTRASGFELTSRFAPPGRPPASLLVGLR